MNLMTILIPFLLLAMKSFELSIIDTTLPAISPNSAPPTTPTETPLQLKLAISQYGIDIKGADSYLFEGGTPPTVEGDSTKAMIPCGSGLCNGVKDYDWAKLRQDLTMIKKKAKECTKNTADTVCKKDSDNIIFMPGRNIRYELIIAMMDTSRNGSSIKDLKIENPDLVVKLDQKGTKVIVEGKEVLVPRKLFPNVVMAGGMSIPGK
jgi:hypothetical protein